MKTYKTNNGIELLKDWQQYTQQQAIAEKAVKKLLPKLIFKNGKTYNNIFDAFGLPYTSTSNFAALWNCHEEAFLFYDGAKLYFKGVAIDEDNTPVFYFLEYDENGEEKKEHFYKKELTGKQYALKMLDCHYEYIFKTPVDKAYYEGLRDMAQIFISNNMQNKKYIIKNKSDKHIIKKF